jgi:hypothetical protein
MGIVLMTDSVTLHAREAFDLQRWILLRDQPGTLNDSRVFGQDPDRDPLVVDEAGAAAQQVLAANAICAPLLT